MEIGQKIRVGDSTGKIVEIIQRKSQPFDESLLIEWDTPKVPPSNRVWYNSDILKIEIVED